MQKGFYRFYPKEKWFNRNVEIEDTLYSEIKKISDSKLDASINKLIDACVENFKIEKSIRLRESMWNKLERYKKEYDISLYKLINMSIKYTLDNN